MALPRVKSYREFLRTYSGAEQTDAAFSKKKKEAQRTFDEAQSTYGATAEALANVGLSKSGYASYLNEKAKGALSAAKADIAGAEATEETKRRSSYEKYLEGLEKQRSTAKAQLHRALLSSKTTSLDSAMRIAEIYGLSKNEAKESVESAVALNVEFKKQQILDKIRTERISAERAVYYGQNYGLPEDVIEELRAFAEQLYGKSASGLNYEDYQQAN